MEILSFIFYKNFCLASVFSKIKYTDDKLI